MRFGEVLRAIHNGARATRSGWNGRGMFIFLVPGSTFAVNRPPLLGIYPEGTQINYHPHIDMKTADGTIVPWVASQSDLLGEDWALVDVAGQPLTSSMERVARDRAATLTCPAHEDGIHRFGAYDVSRADHTCACGAGALEGSTIE
jgi:hypothetical protein